MKIVHLTAFLAALVCMPQSAMSAVSVSDFHVAARALSFMTNAPVGTIRVGIVFDPANPHSAADAAEMQRLLSSGLQVGNLTLQPVMVRVDDVDNAQVALFFLTEGVGAVGRLAEVARSRSVPCITTDLARVREGVCAIGVRSSPRVEILVNQGAAGASGIRFSTAFRMLITEF
jgi:ABC-type uncharacterized transport system substrate-binding protein